MKNPLLTTLFLLLSLAMMAQPGDPFAPINGQANTHPFLQCVIEEAHFANYAVEAQSAQITITDTAHCKLLIPRGYNAIWKDIETSKKHKKGLFDYSLDFFTGIQSRLREPGRLLNYLALNCNTFKTDFRMSAKQQIRNSLYLRTMIDLIHNKLDEIIAVCKKHHVASIALFGSAVSDNMHADSDIDLLVEFSDMDVLDYADNYFSMLDKLQEILKMKVDLVSIRSLKNPVFREEVFQSKVDLYAA